MNPANNDPKVHSGANTLEKAAPQRSPLDERLFMTIVVGGVVVMLAVMMLTFRGKQREEPLREFRQVGNFQLIERSGRVVSETDLRGKIVVVDFFFGGCSAQCLTLGQQMATLQKLTAGMNDVILVSITVDPRSDTPQVLTRYADRMNADSNRWLFLTGDRKIIYPLIQQSFLLAVADENNLPESPDPSFIHSDKIALVDKRGIVRAYYDGLDSSTPQMVLAGIRRLSNDQATK
jgi:cytochrome oxidase Cu insertion factor (SCO1/SenC/PrrC family)